MKPYYETPNGMLLNCDVLTGLKALEPKSVNCCVTSPPYWGLRSYGTDDLIWDGVNGCEHVWGESQRPANYNYEDKIKAVGNLEKGHQKAISHTTNQFCQTCGAWKGSLGLEPTPELFISHLVQVFHEVKRVLKDDGTFWVNIGDTYAASRCYQMVYSQYKNVGNNISHNVPPGLKPKDLVGIPWMLAFALRADGWYLRQDIIWAKNNPMPESVRDRCTKAHEYVFLLSKSQKYFYDYDAILEPSKTNVKHKKWVDKKYDQTMLAKAQKNGVKGRPIGVAGYAKDGKRNKRSVWTVSTNPCKEAHFATFPEKLIVPMINAGCPAGGTVLDPFFGAGTTGLVSEKSGHKWVGIELNEGYCEIAARRIEMESRQLKLFALGTRNQPLHRTSEI